MNKLTVIAVAAITLFSCSNDKKSPNVVQTHEIEAAVSESDTPHSNDSKDALIKLGEEYIPKVVDAYSTHKRNQDSIRAINRTKIFGIQIGHPISNEEDALIAYKNTLSKSDNIRILKKSKNEYFIVKQGGLTREEAEVELKELLKDLAGKDLHVIDLMTFCRKKQKIKEESQKINKEKVLCLICD